MLPTTIGPFQIQRELGRGGMGVVYLATDTRLDRPVAIKALPADLAADPDRLARFQREAKVLAALNHPNVGGIHGLEQADGHQYLVLEYIEGETLADRLAKGAIPVEEALGIARQIAEALEVAHEKGVIHRDLKPANVMLTPEGAAKVLDFGLARSEEGAAPATAVTVRPDAPTTPARLAAHSPTIPGAIMGTAGYMSPEQARGKPVDKRSDIFSFGCVLYEMLTGTMPFAGETVADAIGATLHKESDLSLLPAGTPRRVRELLANCLAKDRKQRLHDIGDARLELERAISGREWLEAPGSASASGALSGRTRTWVISTAWVAALAAGAAGWWLATKFTRPEPAGPRQTFHVSTTIQSKPAFQGLWGISPDARFLVYTAWPELEPESETPGGVLVVRRLDRDETTVIEGTEGAQNAALSPDGRWLAFSCAKDRARSKFNLKKVALENGRPSGRPQTICDLPVGSWFYVGWASDREVVFSPNLGATVNIVPTAGGEPRAVISEDGAQGVEGLQDFRPLIAGKAVLATNYSFTGEKFQVNVVAIDLASGKRTVVLRDAGSPQLVSISHAGEKDAEHVLLALRGDMGGLLAVRFDLPTLRALGDPVTVWNGAQINKCDLSPSGTLAMITQAQASTGRRLAWIDERGQPEPLPGAARPYTSIAVSPDGGRVLAIQESATPNDMVTQVWMQDLTRKTTTRIPFERASDSMAWSSDGRQMVYNSFSKDEFSIWLQSAGGTGDAVKIYATPLAEQLYPAPSAWSPDGKILAISQQNIKTSKGDVLMLEQEAGAAAKWKATPYLNSPADEHALRFSPDGKWVLFCSVESGRHELYVQGFTGAGSGAKDAASGRVQVSTNGHDGAAWWSPDGKELRFIDGNRQVVSVEVKTEPTFAASLPKVLYSIKELKTRNFSWSPDGRLMMILEGDNERTSKIDLVVNFAEEIRAKLPAAK